MSLQIDKGWLLLAISHYLSTRLSQSQIDDLNSVPDQIFAQLVAEIEDAISIYNNFHENLDLYLNALHLKSLRTQLPAYSQALKELVSDQELLNKVLAELRNSTYFNDVYKISNSLYLLANIMTLIYRGYMLHTNPELRPKGAQISSTLEEMSADNYLSGHDTLHFQATKHWILDWEREGFSEELANRLETTPTLSQ